MPTKKRPLWICPKCGERFVGKNIETFNPHCHAHYLRVAQEADLDADIAHWLKEAYEVGQQKHLL